MGGRQGTTGQRLEIALIRDVLAEGVIRDQTGDNRFLAWLGGESVRSVEHQGRIQAGEETVDADVVVELGDGKRIWVEAKTKAKVNSEEVRKDVAKMWRHFENAHTTTDIRAYVLATNADSPCRTGWYRLSEALDEHRSVGSGRKDLLNILGIDADDTASGPDEFLRMLHASAHDRTDGDVSERLASRLGDTAAAKPIADAITTMIVDRGGKFDPIPMDRVLDVLRERQLIHHVETAASQAIKRVRAASEQPAARLPSLHPEHPEWRIDRSELLSDLDAAVSNGDVVLEGVSGSGKSSLLHDWSNQRKPGEILWLTGDRYRAMNKTWSEPWPGAGPSELLHALVDDGVQVLALDDIDDLIGESLQGLREVVRAARVTRGLRVVIAARPRSVASFVSAAERRHTSVKMPELTDDEIRGADTDYLDGLLSFLFLADATGLRRLARRPFVLSLLVRLRVAGIEPAAFTDPDRVPTEEELVVRVWRHALIEGAAAETRDEKTSLEIASARLTSPVVGAGQIDGDLSRLRDAGILGRDDEELAFTHRGFEELATAIAIARGYVPNVSLPAWLNTNASPLVRLGVVRSLLANDLHGSDPDQEKIRQHLATLFADDVTLALRLDAADAIARNTTAATAEAVMDAFTAAGAEVRAATLESFLTTTARRIREGSLEAKKNTTILRRATRLLDGAERAAGEHLADHLLGLAEDLATHTPNERMDEVRPAVMELIDVLDAWSMRSGERVRTSTRLRVIRTVLHVLQDDAAAIAAWAADSLDDPAFAEELLTELSQHPPADPLRTLAIWERACATLRASRGDPYYAERILPTLLEACPEPATASAIRLLTLQVPRTEVSDEDGCAEDVSAVSAGPFTRSLDSWNFPATALPHAWRRWANLDSGSKPELDKLEASVRAVERHATTVLPRALLLETVAALTDAELTASDALTQAVWKILRVPAWVARPSMIWAAGKALSALSRVDTTTGLAVAKKLFDAAREPKNDWREGVLHALAELSDHPRPDVREVGLLAQTLGGRTLEPTQFRFGFERPDLHQMTQLHYDALGVDMSTDAYRAIRPMHEAFLDASKAEDYAARRSARAWLTGALTRTTDPRDRALRILIERELAGECERIADKWWDANQADQAWTLEQLPVLSRSEDPHEDPPPLSNLSTVHPDARAACARALATLDVSANLDDVLPEDGLDCARRLLADPNPKVRADSVRVLGRYEKEHPEWMWQEADGVAAGEDSIHAGQLLFWLAYALRYAIRRNPTKARDLLQALLERARPEFTHASWAQLRTEVVQQLAVVAIENGVGLWDDLVAVAESGAPDDLNAITEIAVPWHRAEDLGQRERARDITEHALRASKPGTRSAVHAVSLEIARGARLESSTWKLLGDILSRQALDRETLDVVIMAAHHTTQDSPERSMQFLEALCAKSPQDLGFARHWDQSRFVRRTADLLLSLAMENESLRQRAAKCADLLRPLDPTEAGRLLDALRGAE